MQLAANGCKYNSKTKRISFQGRLELKIYFKALIALQMRAKGCRLLYLKSYGWTIKLSINRLPTATPVCFISSQHTYWSDSVERYRLKITRNRLSRCDVHSLQKGIGSVSKSEKNAINQSAAERKLATQISHFRWRKVQRCEDCWEEFNGISPFKYAKEYVEPQQLNTAPCERPLYACGKVAKKTTEKESFWKATSWTCI